MAWGIRTYQPSGWEKGLDKGFYSVFTGKRYKYSRSGRRKRNKDDGERYAKILKEHYPQHLHIKQYRTSGKHKFIRQEWADMMNSIDWVSHGAVFSDMYGKKGSKEGDTGVAYNLADNRINYTTEWEGPSYDEAKANPNYKKIWNLLSHNHPGSDHFDKIDKDRWSDLKKFLKKIRVGGDILMKTNDAGTLETERVLGTIQAIKDKAKEMPGGATKYGDHPGAHWSWKTMLDKDGWMDEVVNEIAKSDEYKWIKNRDMPVVVDGKFDIRDFKTTGLDQLSDQVAREYESRYIDEWYGTDDRESGTEGYGWEKLGDSTSGKYIRSGLHLERVDVGFAVGTDQHYNHLTRGKVDWAHYRTDPEFIKAARHLNIDLKTITSEGDFDQTGQKTIENIGKIERMQDLINSDRHHEGAGWKAWDPSLDWAEHIGGEQLDIDDNGVAWSTDLNSGNKTRLIGFHELAKVGGKYYVPPGETKEFVVGHTLGGEEIRKEYSSVYTDTVSYTHLTLQTTPYV